MYLTDAALLERLAQDKLAGIAAEVQAEGWAWVDATPGMTHADLQAFQRARGAPQRPNKRDAQRIEKLQTKMHELAEAVDAALDADDEEKADALQEEGERLGEQLQALEDGLLDYAANVKAAAGAIVSIDRDGLAVIHRGLLREAEAKALRTLERLQQRFGSEGEAGNDDEGENGYDDRQPKAAAMSDRLAQRLSAHRTAELQIEVARHPQVALAALVHGMVQTVLQESYYGPRSAAGCEPETARPAGKPCPGRVGIACRRCAPCRKSRAKPCRRTAPNCSPCCWRSRRMNWCGCWPCVASTVDVVTPRATPHQPGAELAQAVGLDMAAWWKPTADSYFQHVPKAAILEAVGEFAPDHVTRLAKLKKADIASEAERLADGTGWMPAIFRTEDPQQMAQDAATDDEAEALEEAAAVADEQPQAEALAA